MERNEAKMASTASQVLAIGDQQQQQEEEQEKPVEEYTMKAFHEDCGRHLSLLLTRIPSPIPKDSSQWPLEWIGFKRIRKENEPTCYQFFCVPPQQSRPVHLNLCYAYQTASASAIMREVRKILIGECWLSKYVVTGPMKGKLDRSQYDPEDIYVRNALYTALQIEREETGKKMFTFILNLHKTRNREKRGANHLKLSSS